MLDPEELRTAVAFRAGCKLCGSILVVAVSEWMRSDSIDGHERYRQEFISESWASIGAGAYAHA